MKSYVAIWFPSDASNSADTPQAPGFLYALVHVCEDKEPFESGRPSLLEIFKQ